MKVGIAGLGLIGGSFGLALQDSGYADRVLGFDQSKDHLDIALQKCIIEECCASLEELTDRADILILAMPVQIIRRVLPAVLDRVDRQMVIDVGSTKKDIIDSVKGHPNRARYLPTHPMAGTEYS